MKNILVLTTLMLSFFISDLSASHIVAGFSSYKHLAEDSYELKFTLIRDKSSTSGLDEDIFIQVYSFDGFNYTFHGNVLTEIDGIYQVDHGDQALLANQFNIELEYAEYMFEFELTNSAEDYLFVYQRCCRSPNFSNISNPSENGITLITTITPEAQAIKNSSIEFNKLPNFIALVNQEQSFPINATSIDGDTLSYQFAPSYYGGGLAGFNGSGSTSDCDGVSPQGPCYPPYNTVEFSFSEGNFNTPFPAWEDQAMNANNGLLEGVPSEIGQHAYGFAIHEYRNGQIINTTSFDYIVYVVPFVSSTDEISSNELKLIGNPSSERFILESNIDQALKLEIFNMKGEIVQASFEVFENRTTIDFEGTSGMYILKARNKHFNQNLKLIKL